jgi:O-antigen/teichoic acid export membrane protein
MFGILQDNRLVKIFKTGFSSLFIKIVSVGISFISVPMTLAYLGNERYGVWLTITSVFALITFADLGLGNSLTNSIAKSEANQSDSEAKIQISNTFFTLISISLLLFIVFLFSLSQHALERIFKFDSILSNFETANAIQVIACFFIFNLPFGIVQRIYEGLQKGYIFQYFLLISNLLGFLFLYVFIHLKLGLPYLSVALLSPTFIANLFAGVYLFLFLKPSFRPSYHLIEKKVAKSNLKVGLIFFALQVFGFLNLSSDNFIIMYFSNVGNVPAFDIVKKLFTVSFLLVYFIAPLWPAFSDALLKHDYEWAKTIFYKSLLYSLLVTACMSGLLLIFSPIILNRWVGPSIKPTWNLLVSFYFFTIVANYGGVMGALMSTKDLLRSQLKFVGLATTVTLLLKVIFMHWFGLDYLIWANVIGFGIFFVLPSLRMVNQIFSSKVVLN